MGYFAEIDGNGIVLRVIVADQPFIDSGLVGKPANWVETSYDTSKGENPKGVALRKNYAGIGYKYDAAIGGFIPPKPKEFDSWQLSESKGMYEPAKEFPKDGKPYDWDEKQLDWVEVKPSDASVEAIPR